jgi:hypothetical protein
VIRRVGSGTFVAPSTTGGQRLQDPHDLFKGKLTGRLVATQMFAAGAVIPEPMAGQTCGLVARVWSSGTTRMIEEQIWLPVANERELRKIGSTPLLGWLSVEGLFAKETIEAVVVQGGPFFASRKLFLIPRSDRWRIGFRSARGTRCKCRGLCNLRPLGGWPYSLKFCESLPK